MPYCSFDEGAAVFDATPVDNMFITEYMLRAPGDFVKVYLYALMLCSHPQARMSDASMANTGATAASCGRSATIRRRTRF